MRIIGYIIIIVLFLATHLSAQDVSIQYINEAQYGNLPDQSSSYFLSDFNQLSTLVNYKGFEFWGRLNSFINDNQRSRNYLNLSQLSLSYQSEKFKVVAGHFYDNIGRGLLMRSYEIPGVIFEDQGNRVRQAFYKDLLGVHAAYTHNGLNIEFNRAKQSNLQYPVNQKATHLRDDLITSTEIGYSFASSSVGLNYLSVENDFENNQYLSTSYQSSLNDFLNPYVELATSLDSDDVDQIFKSTSANAIYISNALFLGNLNATLEYKRYHNFIIGSGVNDPPATVKEHNWVLPNRSTHIIYPVNESGFQSEFYYFFNSGNELVLNLSQTKNSLASTDYFFKEVYVGYNLYPTSNLDLNLYGDWSKDEFAFENHRYAGGYQINTRFKNDRSIYQRLELQHIDRDFSDSKIWNLAFSLGSHFKEFDFNYTLERSTDPNVTDKANTPSIETKAKYFHGVTFKYSPSAKINFRLFAGSRRGGPACTGGICYEVLDFKGFELRTNFNF